MIRTERLKQAVKRIHWRAANVGAGFKPAQVLGRENASIDRTIKESVKAKL